MLSEKVCNGILRYGLLVKSLSLQMPLEAVVLLIVLSTHLVGTKHLSWKNRIEKAKEADIVEPPTDVDFINMFVKHAEEIHELYKLGLSIKGKFIISKGITSMNVCSSSCGDTYCSCVQTIAVG